MNQFTFAARMIPIFGVATIAGIAIAQTKPKAKSVIDARDRHVSNSLTRALRARISSPGGSLKIAVQPGQNSERGYFSDVVVIARPAQIKKLRISELNMRARNVRVNVASLLLQNRVDTLTSKTSLRAVVTENDLTSLLAQGKSTRDMKLRVKYIGGGKMSVTGKLNYTLLSGPISGVARLRMAPNYTVRLDILSLKLRGAEVPQFVKNQLDGRINPVINYQDLPFRPQFRRLIMQGSRATLIA